MVGAVTMQSARIWAQLPVGGSAQAALPARLWIEYQALDAENRANGHLQKTEVQTPAADAHGAAAWLIGGLKPGTHYQYRVHWRKGATRAHSAPLRFRTEELWPYRKDPPPLRILASSCAYTNDADADRPGKPYGQSTAIFQSMAARKPDVNLWMGDNIYYREVDFDDESAMARRYDQWRALPDLQALLQTGRHIATWDDHDYGPNDSNASYTYKDQSLKLFQRYWANPSYGLPGLPGVFTRYSASDVDFFMLDDRWYRDSDKLVDTDRQMLGQGQLRWLKNALMASTATWKIIVSGSQVLNLGNRYEGWHQFPQESHAFLAWLEQQKLPGVLLLSGDRHFSTLLKLERPGTYPLYELTCSPSTANAYQNPTQDLQGNTRIVAESVVTQNNFCELEVTGARGQRSLNLSIRDAAGALRWSQRLQEGDLR